MSVNYEWIKKSDMFCFIERRNIFPQYCRNLVKRYWFYNLITSLLIVVNHSHFCAIMRGFMKTFRNIDIVITFLNNKYHLYHICGLICGLNTPLRFHYLNLNVRFVLITTFEDSNS